MKKEILKTAMLCTLVIFGCSSMAAQAGTVYLAEHPRPDFERKDWQNLNGLWSFEFDKSDLGKSEKWQSGKSFSKKINVPFPWGSPLSGVNDEADIAWYQKEITVPSNWQNKRTFLVIGASDWETEVWLDQIYLGKHQGGYMPFSFDLSHYIQFGKKHTVTIRVDDKRRDFTLYGKQGYGNARGIWQTIYLEARGQEYLDNIQFRPDIDKGLVTAKVFIPFAVNKDLAYEISINGTSGKIHVKDTIKAGRIEHNTTISIPNQRLWSLEDPFLYDAVVKINNDEVHTYFGMRKIAVTNLPGSNWPYISLNNKPIYLQLALDQSYHPTGYYTFPSDEFMKNEIIISKSIGLNGIRTHIKPDIPRKLYWADKLGLLVMADLPNSWGEPEPLARKESETTLREMIQRDFNHPSIFSWIVFNETWGLTTKVKNNENKMVSMYLPETQNWVASMYYLTKALDPTRLVEDNSICCGRGHTQTDITSWHEYLPGWEWDNHLKKITDNIYAGSEHLFEKGFKQNNQPNINSECGNVWGYEGSTGDVDWSYDYHRMINTFRKYPQVAGWLYTEHHDVINEWNGYWRFDRSEKDLGLHELVEGMTLKDFHSPLYLSTGNEICYDVKAGETKQVPLFISNYKNDLPDNKLKIHTSFEFFDRSGSQKTIEQKNWTIDLMPWTQKQLDPISILMPDTRGMGILKLFALSTTGDTLHRNFVHFLLKNGKDPEGTIIESISPSSFIKQSWTNKQWNVLNGLKVNGAGQGYFKYQIPITQKWNLSKIKEGYLLLELSAKQLFDKDKDESFDTNQDYMKGSRVSPSKNPNAYPMTDEEKFVSTVNIIIGGKKIKTIVLPDDPADHRGVLSWHAQPKDRKLREAGSYGYLIKIPLEKSLIQQAQKTKSLDLKLETMSDGGLAIYGAEFGRYPIDIQLVLKQK